MKDCLQRGGFLAEIVCQPCILFYIFLIAMCLHVDWVYQLDSVFGLLDPRITIFETKTWSDHPREPPQALCLAMREALCKTTVCDGDDCRVKVDEACVAQYPDPCEVVKLPHLSRWLMLLAPPCVILALILSLWHSWKHLRHGRPWDDEEMDKMHDLSIQICGLAPVYGIFSLMSVVHMVAMMEGRTDTDVWKADVKCDQDLLVNGIHSLPQTCWTDYIERSERWYNLNFLVADLYEAWALRCFGELCMEYIDLQRRKRGLLSHSCPQCQKKCPHCDGENLAISQVLLEPLKTMTLQGLEVFVWTNYFRSVLMILLEAWYPTEVEAIATLRREESARLHNAETQQVEFLITRGHNRIQVSVAEQPAEQRQSNAAGAWGDEEQVFWHSASVTLLA